MTDEKTNPEKQGEDYEIDTLTNDRLMKDHEYDGIRELDNAPPVWFTLLFIVTIVFSILYLYILFVFKPAGLVQEKEFARQMAQASASMPGPSEVFDIMLLTDDVSLAGGRQIYNNVCAVCHLTDGGGLVGPNLTDKHWIHGNTIEELYRVVTEGVIEKGMIPYRDQLSPRQRLEVSSYILEKLYGSTPANPKAPEGEIID